MEIKKETLLVKQILANPDKKELESFLENINFSPKERDMITDFVFLKKSIKEVSIEKNLCTSQVAKIKRKLYTRIYDFYIKKVKTV